ncbi:MAG: DUF2339 domain-containing protein [Alphaproteobacteria bacterium]
MYHLFPLYAIAFAVLAFFLRKERREMRALRGEVAGLGEKYGALDRRVAELIGQIGGAPPGEAPSPQAAAETPEPVAAPAPVAEEAAGPEPVAPEPAMSEPVASAAAPPLPEPVSPLSEAWAYWEPKIVENWLVWLGGAALALGGAFLVKLSIDYGWLTPAVRVVLGALFGIALAAGAEWLRRREPEEAAGSYVPQALAAAGAATVFAAIYAAHQLYGLLPSGIAFALLAATAGAAVALSLRHGPLVAALGLIGAYVVPLLVESNAPHAPPLFAYLAVVTAGSLALVRHRAWWWLVWFSLAGAMLWVPLWFAAAPADPATATVAVYLLVQLALFAALRHGVPRVAFLAGTADTALVRAAVRAAFWAVAAGLLLTAHEDRFAVASVAAATVAIVGIFAVAYRDAALDDTIAAAGALALALLASWSLPLPAPDLNLGVFRLQPDHVGNFTTFAILYAALLGGGGFAALQGAARPGRWAGVSAGAPLLILIVAYWRLQRFDLHVAWTLLALALAGVELLAALAVAKRRDGGIEIETALAAYAVAVLGGTIVAAAFALSEAWLTVALALHLPAIGWVETRTRVAALRWVALAIAAAVLVRLVANPYVLDYPLGPTPIFNWLLYGYGVPAAAFIVATRQFGATRDDALVWVLEGGSLVFTLLLLTLELIHALYGRLTMAWLDDFGAAASLIALWIVFAVAAIALGEYRERPVLRWGGRLLLGVTTAFSLLYQLARFVSGARTGDLVVFNGLLFADAIPALSYAILAWLVPHRKLLRRIAAVLAVFYALAWITLEIRRFFHAEVELFGGSTDVEWYLYSVAWLTCAVAALVIGLIRNSEWLRRCGLIGVGLVVAKVFLSDMAELEGVLRALSFIGLGGALVGLGYAYRRLRPPPATPVEPSAAPT